MLWSRAIVVVMGFVNYFTVLSLLHGLDGAGAIEAEEVDALAEVGGIDGVVAPHDHEDGRVDGGANLLAIDDLGEVEAQLVRSLGGCGIKSNVCRYSF